jgi:hypothetical protein
MEGGGAGKWEQTKIALQPDPHPDMHPLSPFMSASSTVRAPLSTIRICVRPSPLVTTAAPAKEETTATEQSVPPSFVGTAPAPVAEPTRVVTVTATGTVKLRWGGGSVERLDKLLGSHTH